jgi:hypothetical protein
MYVDEKIRGARSARSAFDAGKSVSGSDEISSTCEAPSEGLMRGAIRGADEGRHPRDQI